MMEQDQCFAWYGNLRHQGLFISPAVLMEYFPEGGCVPAAHEYDRLRDRINRFIAQVTGREEE